MYYSYETIATADHSGFIFAKICRSVTSLLAVAAA
jgi:hypothetical protein